MADMKQIHNFAVKWRDKFRDKNINYIELVDHWMADDCDALGFEMDCGDAFSEKYGDAVYNYESLNKIIADVTDITLLGSAIYSRWRYFNHWAYTGEEILEPKNREWFIIAFNRLALLSEENPSMFRGTLKKVRIASNNICFAPLPEPNDEVEQHITVNNKGRVWVSRYNCGHSFDKHEKASSINFTIEKSSADKLLMSFADYFGHKYSEIFVTDVGVWKIELTNTEGTTYTFTGSLCANLDDNLTYLSKLVRDTLGIDDLYIFDGK